MITCKCIQKFRNRNNVIYGYRLVDINGKTQDVTPNDLKNAIKNSQVNVVNLSLTVDGRLVDRKEEDILQNKTIMPNEVKKPKEINDDINAFMDRLANKIVRALGGSEVSYIDHDDSTSGYVHMVVGLPNLIYRGVRRDLDMLLDMSEANGKFCLGLIDEEAFYTEADTDIDIGRPLKNYVKRIEEMVDKYIIFLRKASEIPYYAIVNTVEIDEDHPIHRSYSPYQILYKVTEPGTLDSLVDYYFNNMYNLYEIDSDEAKVMRDNIPMIAVKFYKGDEVIETLFYFVKQSPDIKILIDKFHIKKQKGNKERMEFCEKYMGLSHFKYLGTAGNYNTGVEDNHRVVTLDVFVR